MDPTTNVLHKLQSTNNPSAQNLLGAITTDEVDDSAKYECPPGRDSEIAFGWKSEIDSLLEEVANNLRKE